jgi:hypothetical protein
MKTIVVSARDKALNDLLRKARRGAVVLESADGQRFALTAVHNWEGFDVGSSNDFAQEVERTGKNKRLMKFMARRKKSVAGKGIPLAEVKKQLGID